jgi:DNA-binding LytR/AlgR family response regulator
MKCTTVIDKDRDEEVVIYVHHDSELAQKIRQLCEESPTEIIGYEDTGFVLVDPNNVYCFTLEGGKLYALTDKKRLLIKQRLYEIEKALDNRFVKINQSCIVNIGHIERFDTSLGGSLTVILKNGYKDYISRRQLKHVKERIGFKL